MQTDSFVKQYMHDFNSPPGAVLGLSYAVAEAIDESREVAPFYFDHVGNAAVGMVISVATNAWLETKFKSINPRHTRLAGLAAGIILNAIIEHPGSFSVSDPKDFAYGVVGSIAGYFSTKKEKRRHNLIANYSALH